LLLFSNLAHANLWKAYLSYYEPTEIEQASGNMLYVLASGALYSYNRNDQSLQTYDKTTVLSDCDIAHIAWCQAARRLVVVYTNGNIDLLDQNSNVTNMANYMNKSMTEDKTVYSIDIAGSYAYLSTGFGIMKVNVSGPSSATPTNSASRSTTAILTALTSMRPAARRASTAPCSPATSLTRPAGHAWATMWPAPRPWTPTCWRWSRPSTPADRNITTSGF
jgi:hypothetical protein